MVQPSNLPDVVQEFMNHLALEPEKMFYLEQNDPGEHLHNCCLFCHSQGVVNFISHQSSITFRNAHSGVFDGHVFFFSFLCDNGYICIE